MSPILFLLLVVVFILWASLLLFLPLIPIYRKVLQILFLLGVGGCVSLSPI